MRELIVAHLSNGTSLANMRLFLRTLHRSGASARADGVVLFPRDYCGSKQVWEVFQEDEASFQRILALSDPETIANQRASDITNSTLIPFNSIVFKRAVEEQARSARVDLRWGTRLNDSQADGNEHRAGPAMAAS